jgi:hypothetical protein
MTTDQFFNTHNIFYKVIKVDGRNKHVLLIINKTTHAERKFNFEYTDNDAMDFALYTGLNLGEVADEELAITVKHAYKITD